MLLLLLALIQSGVSAQTSSPSNSLNDLLGGILQLESDLEPKCDATATRLEDFMYGTPLTSAARYKKIDLQKSLILDIWQQASDRASKNAEKNIGLNYLTPVLHEQLSYSELPNGDWQIKLENNTLTIAQRDKRQYSSIAYALRQF